MTSNEQVAEGKRRAAERFALLTPEQQQAGRALQASAPVRLARTFCSPSNKKGRQTFFIASPVEVLEFHLRGA
jgi:hypothetical protein